MNPANEVKKLLLKTFPDATIQVEDMTGGGDHFEVLVISKTFLGKSLIEQHQAVHAALAGEMDSWIHAVQIKTRVS